MRAVKGSIFLAAIIIGANAAPAMAMTAATITDNIETRLGEAGRPSKKPKEPPAKPDYRPTPKKEPCMTCRILI